MQIPHISVLSDEVKKAFKGLDEGVLIDCTLGFGGHSYALLKEHANLRLLACDKDLQALEFSKQRLAEFAPRCEFVKGDFKDILNFCDSSKVRGVLADIGVSSFQLDSDERGFSIHSNALDMRMDKEQSLSAFEVVNTYSKSELERVFKDFGELANASFLAQKIINARSLKPIESAKELANIIGEGFVKGRNVKSVILAFQALRIEVNGELAALKELLSALERANLKDCIVVIICFHSLEDVLVKNAFKKWAKSCICDENALKCECGKTHAKGRILSKKPIIPSKDELRANSRSSCAKMRIFYFE